MRFFEPWGERVPGAGLLCRDLKVQAVHRSPSPERSTEWGRASPHASHRSFVARCPLFSCQNPIVADEVGKGHSCLGSLAWLSFGSFITNQLKPLAHKNKLLCPF